MPPPIHPAATVPRRRPPPAHGCRPSWSTRRCGPAASVRCGCRCRPAADEWRSSGAYCQLYIGATAMPRTCWSPAWTSTRCSSGSANGRWRPPRAICTSCSRTAGGVVLPPRVHAAARTERAGWRAAALGLRQVAGQRGRHADAVCRRPAVARRDRRLHARAAHLDAGPALPPARARTDGLRRAGRRRRRPAALAAAAAQRELPVSSAGAVQGVQGQVHGRAASRAARRHPAKRPAARRRRTRAASSGSAGRSMPRRRWPGRRQCWTT